MNRRSRKAIDQLCGSPLSAQPRSCFSLNFFLLHHLRLRLLLLFISSSPSTFLSFFLSFFLSLSFFSFFCPCKNGAQSARTGRRAGPGPLRPRAAHPWAARTPARPLHAPPAAYAPLLTQAAPLSLLLRFLFIAGWAGGVALRLHAHPAQHRRVAAAQQARRTAIRPSRPRRELPARHDSTAQQSRSGRKGAEPPKKKSARIFGRTKFVVSGFEGQG